MKVLLGPLVRVSFKGGIHSIVQDTISDYDVFVNTRYFDRFKSIRFVESLLCAGYLISKLIKLNGACLKVHYHTGAGKGLLKDLLLLNLLSRIKKGIFYFHIHFTDLEIAGVTRWLILLLPKTKIRFICMSQSVADRLYSESSVISYSLINYSKVKPSLRKNHSDMNWLYVGSLDSRKNILGLISFFENAPSNCVLNIVGSYQDEDYFKTCLQLAELSNISINFHGYLEGFELNLQYIINDNFILMSRAEGLPLSLLDAAAHGMRIFSTDVGSIKETFGDIIHYIDQDSSYKESLEKIEIDLCMQYKKMTTMTLDKYKEKLNIILDECTEV